jgi:parallel beta-helix repeat protein
MSISAGPVARHRVSRRTLLGGGAACAGLGLLSAAPAVAAGLPREFHVSVSGADTNPGTLQQPFRTIGAVFTSVPDLGSGDRIIVLPGLYEEAVVVKAGGSATANLTLVSQVPQGAKIKAPPSSYSAIAIEKSYVTVDGFDVQSGGTGHGIEATFIDGNNKNDGPHHIEVVNNVCHDCPGSGISLSYGDYYRIENNICYGNCATNEYQGSGISVYEARAVEGSDRLRIFVRRNTCYSNMALVLPGDVPHSDGNGIIIDDLKNTQQPNRAEPYQYQTLVEGNVCYFNGGKGIHVYISENVTVRNNTCCGNNRDPKNAATWRGELSNVDSSNTLWYNNIAVADTKVNAHNAAILDASSNGKPNTNVLWKNNLTFNGKEKAASITQSPRNASLTSAAPYRNMLGVDPRFRRWGQGEETPDFHLQKGSPAAKAGLSDPHLPGLDRDGNPRSAGAEPDLGAYEITD